MPFHSYVIMASISDINISKVFSEIKLQNINNFPMLIFLFSGESLQWNF